MTFELQKIYDTHRMSWQNFLDQKISNKNIPSYNANVFKDILYYSWL